MKTTGLTASEETTLRCERACFAYPHACTHSHRSSHPGRYIVGTSACLSLFGCGVIVYSALRFKELSKRFFAIRLIFFLTVADGCAALFNMMGAFVDVPALQKRGTPSVLCEVQAAGLLYFNLASIMWTSCFAFTLYRDLVPSSFGVGTGRRALRTYESYYHALCWPVRARAHTHARHRRARPSSRACRASRCRCLRCSPARLRRWATSATRGLGARWGRPIHASTCCASTCRSCAPSPSTSSSTRSCGGTAESGASAAPPRSISSGSSSCGSRRSCDGCRCGAARRGSAAAAAPTSPGASADGAPPPTGGGVAGVVHEAFRSGLPPGGGRGRLHAAAGGAQRCGVRLVAPVHTARPALPSPPKPATAPATCHRTCRRTCHRTCHRTLPPHRGGQTSFRRTPDPPRAAGTSTASCCLGPIASRPRTRRATRSRHAAAQTPRPVRLAPRACFAQRRVRHAHALPWMRTGRTRGAAGAVACGVDRFVHTSESNGGEHQDGTRYEQSTEFSLGSAEDDHELAILRTALPRGSICFRGSVARRLRCMRMVARAWLGGVCLL